MGVFQQPLMASSELPLVVRLPLCRPEVRANDTVCAEGDEVPRLPIEPCERSVGTFHFQNGASCRPVAKFLGFSQVLLHREGAELPSMFLIVIDKLLPGCKTDIGAFDARWSRTGLDGILCLPGWGWRGLR